MKRRVPKTADLFRVRSILERPERAAPGHCSRKSHAWIAAIAILAGGTAEAAQTVRLHVQVPPTTPADAPIFVAGSVPAVGSWKADGLKLERQADGSFAADVAFEAGQTLEFKITRGSWETVEKTADGGERANRAVTIDANTKQIDATVERWSAGDAKPASTVVGTLTLHTIESKSLGKPRTIRVWLPEGYNAAAGPRYDVLYMHDGQNCFDRATSAFGHEWQIDETLTKLIADKSIRPIIVVGIDNGGASRIDELTYAADEQHRGGHAASYASFVIDEVIPLIDKIYRTNADAKHRYLGGSSLGGLVSLDIARRHPNTFAGVIAMSPSLWWPAELIIPAVEADAGGLRGTRVWLDMGTREGDAASQPQHVEEAKRMDAALTKQNVEHQLMIDADAEHNETAWARRFPAAIQYLLKE